MNEILEGPNPGGPEAQLIEDTIGKPEEKIAYRTQISQLLSRGYQPSIELAEAAYTALQIVRLRSELEKDRADGNSSTKQSIQAMGDLQAVLRMHIQTLDKRFASGQSDPDQDLRAAESWVLEHLGEFSARCPNGQCGQMLTVPALPHWAFAPIDLQDGRHWMVWSAELWSLVLDRTISLWVMAWVLRTSPEALKITAERRGDAWPGWIDLEAEETALQVRMRTRDKILTIAASE